MVDHPDFCSVQELEKAKATMPLQLLRDCEEDDDEGSAEPGEHDKTHQDRAKNAGAAAPASRAGQPPPTVAIDDALARFDPATQRRSLSSIRSGVTVAMVAVALGFACCKCLLHTVPPKRGWQDISHMGIAFPFGAR
jgi:hypothetical protein